MPVIEKNKQIKRPTLETVLLYENMGIVAGFTKAFGVPLEEASEIFNQVKRMLWLINEMEFEGHKKENKHFSIDASLVVIDEMWHSFILFTKEYREFCFDHFGYFIDHAPTVDSDPEEIARIVELTALEGEARISKVMDEKRWQYTYVFQKLGRDCFVKWYKEYHQKYTPLYLSELRMRAIQARYPKTSLPGA